jgi:hypothetical protein
MTTPKIPVRTVYDNTNVPIGLSEYQVGEVVPIEHGGTNANTVAQAKLNLALDNSNVRALITVTGAGTYDNSTGVISISGGVTSVAGATGAISNSVILAGLVTQGISTSNVIELTNLYFTNTRSFANLLAASTTSLTEGTNLYFTNTRAVDALIGSDVNARNLTLSGNLTVNGNTTFLNVETLNVEDKNILLANGASSAAASDGAGITIDGSFASISYVNTGNKWAFDRNIDVNGSITATGWSSLYTANVVESTNLYFTNTRAVGALTAGDNIVIDSNGRVTAKVVDVIPAIPFNNTNLDFYSTKSILTISKTAFRFGEFDYFVENGINFSKRENEVLHNGTSVAFSNNILNVGSVDIDFNYYIQGNDLVFEAINGNFYVDDYFNLSEQYQSNAIVNVKGHVSLIEV